MRKSLEEVYKNYRDIIPGDSDLEVVTHLLHQNIQYNTKTSLFRYMNSDIFNINNIRRGILRLSANGRMNDVYEGVADCSNGYDESKADYLNKLVYLKCFSENCTSNLMWSHYASSHSGICVEYDLSLLDCRDHVLAHIFPVIYGEKRLKAQNIDWEELERDYKSVCLWDSNCEDDELLDRPFLEDIKGLYLYKNKDWSYEKEWRLIYSWKEFYDKDVKNPEQYDLPFDCVTAIYLGYRINPVVKSEMIGLVRDINNKVNNKGSVKLYQMVLSKDNYEMVPKELN